MRSTSEKQWSYSMTMMTTLVTTERTVSGYCRFHIGGSMADIVEHCSTAYLNFWRRAYYGRKSYNLVTAHIIRR